MEKTIKEIRPVAGRQCQIVGCEIGATFRYAESEQDRELIGHDYCSKHAGVAAVMHNVAIGSELP
jgi:hypothetical protein